jgi:acid phosphatase type 7
MKITICVVLALVMTACTAITPTFSAPTLGVSEQSTSTATHSPTGTPSATASSTPSPSPTQTPTPSPSPTPTPVIFIGAGDIGVCGTDTSEQTAAILDGYPQAAIFTAGDNAYGSGTRAEFRSCFDPTWGRHKDRIRPVPGNHDYINPGAAAYYEYFGEAAGEPGKGYYSYDLGDWHIVALNSLCGEVGGCGIGSAQEQWLRADLTASDKRCTLAYMHYPRWSSGLAGGRGTVSGLVRALVDHGVEVLVSGDDHNYERFAPQNGDGQADPNGIRQFVAGTGGALLRVFSTPQPNSEVRHTGTYGVLKFNLLPDRYSWEFIPVNGQSFSDSGSDICH